MNYVLAIDPGTTESQFLIWDGGKVVDRGLLPNADLLGTLEHGYQWPPETAACIEMVASYGMPVGREVFETVYWVGRIDETLRRTGLIPVRIYRQDVKLHLCQSARAKDGNVRQALIDRFGGKDAAIGRKATPGPLYGVSSHAWAALALAITFADRNRA